MIPRHLEDSILKYAKQYPVVALVGPRQSGKTTLAKKLFPSHTYISLENLDYRMQASTDPRRFLNELGPFLILDEVQRVPELFSYLQELVDNRSDPGQYILTGSSQFLLMESISQSLAGRVITFKLYPLSFLELSAYPPEKNVEEIFRVRHIERKKVSQHELYELLWKGFYPRIYDRGIDSYKWLENYLLTYVERDVRSLLNVRNLSLFEKFLKLIASLSAQELNYSSISNAIGVSLPTIKEWISILETSGIIHILPPYFENFSKRLVKNPKIIFVDTGLLCYLLSIRSVEILQSHPLLGSIFETFIIGECFKRFYNLGEMPPLYFWRDQAKNEIDLLIHTGLKAYPVEIKLSQTFHLDFQKTIQQWLKLDENPAREGSIIFCGESVFNAQTSIPAVPWYFI
ncbi:MAG TPA: AAA family ATPase [Parachlamydiales bacterium]|nr:AAA family ATPase [Parachlamydiales bacterium]